MRRRIRGFDGASRATCFTIEHMTVQRIDHVGIVVDDLAEATEFFVALGLELQREWSCRRGTATDSSN